MCYHTQLSKYGIESFVNQFLTVNSYLRFHSFSLLKNNIFSVITWEKCRAIALDKTTPMEQKSCHIQKFYFFPCRPLPLSYSEDTCTLGQIKRVHVILFVGYRVSSFSMILLPCNFFAHFSFSRFSNLWSNSFFCFFAELDMKMPSSSMRWTCGKSFQNFEVN